MRQQAYEGTHLHQIIDSMARILDAHMVWEAAQCCSLKEWPEDSETKWDDRHKDYTLWGVGIMDMTVKVVSQQRVD